MTPPPPGPGNGKPATLSPRADVETPRRHVAWRRAIGVVVVLAIVGGVIGIVLSLGPGSSGGGAKVTGNSLAIVNPETNEVDASFQNVGGRPSAVAVGDGSVWVANLGSQTVTRLEAATRTLLGTISVDATATGIAAGAGAAWTANGLAGSVSRINPAVNSVSSTIDNVARPSSSGAIAFGLGSVWFASGSGTLSRIDPGSNRVVGEGIAGVSPSAVAVGKGSIWVADAGASSVSRVNPRTVGVVRSITVGRRPRGIAVGDDAVWVTNESDDDVSRIDPASGSTITITVGKRPTGIAVGAGAVWVACSGDGTLSRIDPQTNKVVATIRIGNQPTGVAVGSGVIWVTVQKPG